MQARSAATAETSTAHGITTTWTVEILAQAFGRFEEIISERRAQGWQTSLVCIIQPTITDDIRM